MVPANGSEKVCVWRDTWSRWSRDPKTHLAAEVDFSYAMMPPVLRGTCHKKKESRRLRVLGRFYRPEGSSLICLIRVVPVSLYLWRVIDSRYCRW